MGSTALEMVNSALRMCNESTVASFSQTQEFPGNIVLDCFNTVIREMNRWGSYWFQETDTALSYGVGTYTYTLSSSSIDPNRILDVRRTLTNYQGYLKQMNHRDFLNDFRRAAVETTTPSYWTKFGGVLELSTIPDQDYSLKVRHFKDIPVLTTGDTSTTFNLPLADEDVFVDGIKAYLKKELGRMEWTNDYELYKAKARKLVADMNMDSGLPTVMPSLF